MTDPVLLSKTSVAEWLGIGRSTLSGYLANGQIEPHSLAGKARGLVSTSTAPSPISAAILTLSSWKDLTGACVCVFFMDAETAQKFTTLEAVIARLEEQLAAIAPKPCAEVICMKQAAARLGISRHTMRRRALADPSLGKKIGGRWHMSI